MSRTDTIVRDFYGRVQAEFVVDSLRREISGLLQQLADTRDPLSRPLAVRRLVALAIEACGLVDAACKSDAATVRALAAGLTHWPLNYSMFPGDEEMIPEYVRKLGLGKKAPISLKKWRLVAPGTRWAFAYFQLVDFSRAHFRICGDLPEGDERVTLFMGMQILKADARDAVALPELSKDPHVLGKWMAAYRKHLARHHPGNAVLEVPMWKAYLANKPSLHSAGKQKAKILEMIAAGFKVIAKDA